MDLVEEDLNITGYERVIKVTEKESGLQAIIAIHSTQLGPGVGGTRIYPYVDFDQALTDVLRLSKGMTYKAGITQVGLGGAKSVIIADPKRDKSRELLHAFGRAVDRLKGIYVCAEDVGCTPEDIDVILEMTPYACGVHNLRGSGNPAAFTAHGVFLGIQATLQELYGSDSVKGKRIAIQGMGSVGQRLAERLFWAGGELVIADLQEELLEPFAHAWNAEVVSPEAIISTPCDIFAPCAMGGVLNEASIKELQCAAVVGAANNQLLKPTDADHLMSRGVLYAPDFLINAGGLINVVHELSDVGYNAQAARDMTCQIYDQLLHIYEVSQERSISTHQAAISLVDYRLENGIGKREKPLCFPFAPLSLKKASLMEGGAER